MVFPPSLAIHICGGDVTPSNLSGSIAASVEPPMLHCNATAGSIIATPRPKYHCNATAHIIIATLQPVAYLNATADAPCQHAMQRHRQRIIATIATPRPAHRANHRNTAAGSIIATRRNATARSIQKDTQQSTSPQNSKEQLR